MPLQLHILLDLTGKIFSHADDRIGVAYGQPQKHEDDTVDPSLYEVYYEYQINDSVSITPTIFGRYS